VSGACRALLATALTIGLVRPVNAQDPGPALRPGHVTVSAGLIANGGYSIGDRAAEMRRNSSGTPGSFTLFRADSSFEPSNGLEARVGIALTRAWVLELGGTYAKPELGITITQDSEAAETVRVTEGVSQYTVDVGGVFQPSRLRIGSRTRPYAIIGAGYLRQLHQDRLLVETGALYYVGGGVRYWLRGGLATGRALGIRADARYVRRAGGVDFEDSSRGYPVFSVLAFVGF
jgi:hypothetical protein